MVRIFDRIRTRRTWGQVSPSTPLPWTATNGHYQHITGDDLAYIIHACNNFPRLVEALRSIQFQLYQKDQEEVTRINDAYDIAQTILRELGEE